MFLDIRLLKSTTVQRKTKVNMLNFDRGLNFEQKRTPQRIGPDPTDPADPSHWLPLGTYHPSRAGVRTTEILNKLPRIKILGTAADS